MIIYIEDRVKALQKKIVRAQTHKNGFKSPLTESKVTILDSPLSLFSDVCSRCNKKSDP